MTNFVMNPILKQNELDLNATDPYSDFWCSLNHNDTLFIHSLARGKLAAWLNLVSLKVFFLHFCHLMEFGFLATIASGLLGWGHLKSMLEKITFKSNALQYCITPQKSNV